MKGLTNYVTRCYQYNCDNLYYINLAGAELESSLGNNALCPGERVTFTCTVSSIAHSWRIIGGSTELQIGIVTPASPTDTYLGFELQVVDVTAVPITSTATVNTTVDLNNTVIVCSNVLVPPNRIEQNTTVNIIGELLQSSQTQLEGGSGWYVIRAQVC